MLSLISKYLGKRPMVSSCYEKNAFRKKIFEHILILLTKRLSSVFRKKFKLITKVTYLSVIMDIGN